ncbi:ABC transporter permease [Rothia santali]|uniref:ABC transporter permease n=1 Tax=Rothia santali TaxID=2949643 RepID=UPI0026664AF1|nr:ABC transporter permease [Rothia santali]
MRRALLPALLAVVAAAVLLGPLLVPFDPSAQVAAPWRAADAAHPLGTDALGRDVLSRVLSGGVLLLGVAVLAALLTSALGVLGGLAAGWVGGWAERALTGVSDLLLVVPSLLIALVVATGFPGPGAVVAATVCGGAPLTVRVVRDAVLSVRSSGHVEAARCRGERGATLLLREVLPALRGTVTADLGLRLVIALQVTAALNVLGVGLTGADADWARMVRENMVGVGANPWGVLAPALALGAVTLVLALGAQLIGRERPVPIREEPRR